MSVKYINYKDMRLPIKLGYYALKMLQEEHGVTMSQMEEKFSTYEPLLFYSLQQGHKVMNMEFTWTMDDMVDILDDCFFEFVELIPEFFPDLEKTMGAGMVRTKKDR
jgi:hypothetical protein